MSGKVRRRTSNSGLLSGLASKNQTFGDTAFINSGTSLVFTFLLLFGFFLVLFLGFQKVNLILCSGLSMYRAVAEKDTVLLAMGVAFISYVTPLSLSFCPPSHHLSPPHLRAND